MALIFYATVAVACLIALGDWRAGIFVAIVLDCFRDPIRKLTPGEPTLLTYCVCLIWGCAFLSLFFSNDKTLAFVRKRFPWIEKQLLWFVLALAPGALLSLALYQNGFILAGLGAASYAAPLAGIAIGAAMSTSPKRIDQLLRIYVIVNCIALVGSVAEFQNWDWPALGGLQGFTWIRHQPGVIVRLISGWFRSPDIAGFHAANVGMVSVVLLFRRGFLRRLDSGVRRLRQNIDWVWALALLWSLVPLFLSGRRKMMIMPVVFVASYVLYIQLATKQSLAKTISFLVIIAALVALPAFLIGDMDNVQDHRAYLESTVVDAVPRLQGTLVVAISGTIAQSGFLGSGLGVATQGAQYFAVGAARRNAWQEDGVSRIFKELGIPGVIIIGLVIIGLSRRIWQAIKWQRNPMQQQWQGMILAIVFANLASFVASHQHFSGDPANGLWVLFLMGLFLGSLALGATNPSRPIVSTATR